jgi:hypothetical protein
MAQFFPVGKCPDRSSKSADLDLQKGIVSKDHPGWAVAKAAIEQAQPNPDPFVSSEGEMPLICKVWLAGSDFAAAGRSQKNIGSERDRTLHLCPIETMRNPTILPCAVEGGYL